MCHAYIFLPNLHSHCPSEDDDILLTWAVVVLICANCDANGLKPIMVCKYYNSVHHCSLGGRAQHAKWLADGRLLFQHRSTSLSVSSASVSCASSWVVLFKLMAILIIVKSRWWVKGLTIAWVALCEFHQCWIMCVKYQMHVMWLAIVMVVLCNASTTIHSQFIFFVFLCILISGFFNMSGLLVFYLACPTI